MKKISILLLITAMIMMLNIIGVIAEASDAIPVMTSDTSPSVVVSASGYLSSLAPWKAFDNNPVYYVEATNSTHAWGTSATTGWLAYEFASSKVIVKYTLQETYHSSNTLKPKDWTFEAW